jgi:drug/metabolite transporter (DMT)-like permease
VTPRSQLVGGLFALLAGVTFGVTTPFVHQLGAGVGTFGTSALLYGGAALFCAARRPSRPIVLPRRDMVRLVAVALLGGVVAPALLVWGLARTDGARASLALGVEMPFTVLLARLLFGERIGLRMGAAVTAMLASTTLLALPAEVSGLADSAASSAFPLGPASTLGLAAVIGAALAWATDSAVMRPLSSFDPRAIVARKSAIGALVLALLGLGAGESFPPLRALVPLALLGALGYGVSLQCYLLAQRRIGAARAASLFAIAPLAGAVTGVIAGQAALDLRLLLAATACAFAVALQLVESGAHPAEMNNAARPEEGTA